MSEAEKKLTFSDVERLLRADPEERQAEEPVRDHRIVAGLLFARYNDGSTRHLLTGRSGPPLVVVHWGAGWNPFDDAEIEVDPAAVEFLLNGRYLEGTPEWGRTDMTKLRLSQSGMRELLQKWVGGGTLHDFFQAGGSLDMSDGRAHWPRN